MAAANSSCFVVVSKQNTNLAVLWISSNCDCIAINLVYFLVVNYCLYGWFGTAVKRAVRGKDYASGSYSMLDSLSALSSLQCFNTVGKTFWPEKNPIIPQRLSLRGPSPTWSNSRRTHTHTTILQPFFQDHTVEPVPEEIFFWALWCEGR